MSGRTKAIITTQSRVPKQNENGVPLILVTHYKTKKFFKIEKGVHMVIVAYK